MATEPSSAFTYWTKRGGEQIRVNAEPPTAEEAKPFYVCIRSKRWIPIFVLVFARDEEHAIVRVRRSLEECRDKDWRGEEGVNDGSWLNEPNRAWDLLKRLEADEFEVSAKPYDTSVIAKITWACNNTVC